MIGAHRDERRYKWRWKSDSEAGFRPISICQRSDVQITYDGPYFAFEMYAIKTKLAPRTVHSIENDLNHSPCLPDVADPHSYCHLVLCQHTASDNVTRT